MKLNLRTRNEIKHGEYESEKEAQKTVDSLNKKNPKRGAFIRYRPENIGKGYKIYLTDDSYYGTILFETDYFYYVSKDEDAEIQECKFFVKDNFLEKFDEGIFKPIDG